MCITKSRILVYRVCICLALIVNKTVCFLLLHFSFCMALPDFAKSTKHLFNCVLFAIISLFIL